MADRAQAKSRAKSYTKSKKKGAMDGMTVKGGHKLSVKARRWFNSRKAVLLLTDALVLT